MDFQMKNKLSLCFMIIAIFALSIVLPASAQGNTNKFCVNRDTAKPNAFCSKIISGATTWEQAATWSVNRLLRLTNREVTPMLATIEAKLVPSIAPEKKVQLVKACKDSYDDVVKTLLEAKKFIKSDPLGEFMPKLSFASTCYSDCREGIVAEKGQPEIAELNMFNDHVNKILDVIITVANNDPRVAMTTTTA